MDDSFDEFLTLLKHAKHRVFDASGDIEAAYWQGVKDGLRKLYAVIDNDPSWLRLARSSPERDLIEEFDIFAME